MALFTLLGWADIPQRSASPAARGRVRPCPARAATALPPLLGWAGPPEALRPSGVQCALQGWALPPRGRRGAEIHKARQGERVPAIPTYPHNEAPLLDRERGGEPGALWATSRGEDRHRRRTSSGHQVPFTD